VVFTVVGVVKEQNKDVTGDVSGGLYVIAEQSEMAKSTSSGDKIVFSADDFEKSLNLSEITSITVITLPDVADGCLCLGDVLVNKGQTISKENLDLLNYRVGSEDVKEAEFQFKTNSAEYVITCKLYFLECENSAPTLALEDEKTFNVSTHQTVMVYGKVGAYDPDGDEVRYEIVTYGKNGVINLDSQTGEYTYTPTGAYFGEDKFEYVEKSEKTIYVGDGINDAPALRMASVGVAMGRGGQDSAIEAADLVIMSDNLTRIPTSIKIARKTVGIAKQNIVFAIGVKLLILGLIALGYANMWLAVFADVGVAVIAILNAMRALRVK
jgi:hypothetical protein